MADEDIKALNRIADTLETISQPSPRTVTPSAPSPYLSGQWKRRDGTLYDTPMRGVKAASPPAPLDPQLRRDVPAVDSLEGRAGID